MSTVFSKPSQIIAEYAAPLDEEQAERVPASTLEVVIHQFYLGQSDRSQKESADIALREFESGHLLVHSIAYNGLMYNEEGRDSGIRSWKGVMSDISSLPGKSLCTTLIGQDIFANTYAASGIILDGTAAHSSGQIVYASDHDISSARTEDSWTPTGMDSRTLPQLKEHLKTGGPVAGSMNEVNGQFYKKDVLGLFYVEMSHASQKARTILEVIHVQGVYKKEFSLDLPIFCYNNQGRSFTHKTFRESEYPSLLVNARSVCPTKSLDKLAQTVGYTIPERGSPKKER